MSPTIPGRRLTLPVPPGLKVTDESSGRIIRAITVDLSFIVETDLSSESYQSSPERPSPGSVGDTPGCIPDHRGNESDGESSVSTDLSSEDSSDKYFTPSPCLDNSKTTQFPRYDSRSVKSENDVERLENPDSGSTALGDSIYETPLGLQNSAIKRLFEYESRLTSADSPVSGVVNNSQMCECSFEDTSFHEPRDSEIGNAVNVRPAYNLPANFNSHVSEFKYSHEESAQYIPSVKLEPGIDPPALSFFCHSLSMDMEHLVAKSPQITVPHDFTVNEGSPAKKAKILDENHNILNDPETLPGIGTESGILDSNALSVDTTSSVNCWGLSNSKKSPGPSTPTANTLLKGPRKTAKFVKCEICQYEAPCQQKLRHHYLGNHTGSNTLKCDHPGCIYATRIKKYLKKHMRTHTKKSTTQLSHTGTTSGATFQV